MIYLTSQKEDAILAFNTNTGKIIWENDEVLPKTLLASSEKEIFLFDQNGDIVALDAITGAKLWKFEFGRSIPSAILTNEALIFGTSSIYFIDRKTGQQKQPPLPVGDGVVAIHPKEKLLFVEGAETLTTLG